MKALFTELIADFHQRPLPTSTPRDGLWPLVPSKIHTLTGMRRVGKTFALYQLIAAQLAAGMPKTDIVLINFEDERLLPLNAQQLSSLLDAYAEITARPQPRLLCLDEVQNVPGWERFVRRVHETQQTQLILTGSSANLLSREIATSLRGRALNCEVFPFSFAEYLRHGHVPAQPRSQVDKAQVRRAAKEYLRRGGFPEVLTTSEEIWRSVLQEYVNLVIYRDVVERHGIANHALIKYLVKFLLGNIAAPLTIHKLFRDLKSQGFAVSKDTLHRYLGYLEEAYAVFTVPILSESIRVRNVNYRKLYAIDGGLAMATTVGISERRGALLENAVFLQLRRQPNQDLYYYHTRQGAEIDFVVMRSNRLIDLIQVTEDLGGTKGRDALAADLWMAMEELGVRQSHIVTLEHEETLRRDKRTIHVVPLWQWLLQIAPH